MTAETATAAPPLTATTAEGPSQLVGSELKRLAVHSSHYLAGLLGGLVLGLISFPIFTRAFSIAEYGIIDLAQKVALLLTIASKLGLQNAALRFYDGEQFARDRRTAQTYYSTMLFGVLCTSAAVAVVFLAGIRLFPELLLAGPLARLLYLMMAVALLRALGAILWAFLRIEERTRVFNAMMVASKGATVLAICLLLPWAGRTAGTYLTGIIAVEAALAGALVLWLTYRGVLSPCRFDPALFRAGIAFGMPLVVYELAFAILGSADRFLVRHYLGANGLGFYSVAYGLAQHANELLVTPLGLAILPIYMRIWNLAGARKTSDFLSSALDLYLLATAGVLAVATVSARDIVALFASSKYAGAERLVPLLLGGLLAYTAHIFVAAGLLIHKRTLQMAGVLAVAAVFNVGFNWLMLPRMGLLGGGLATLLSYLLCILWLGYASNRLLPLDLKLGALAKYSVAGSAAWLAGSQIEFDSAALELLGKSAVTALVYACSLYALDRRVRQAVRWALVRRRS